MKSSVLFLTLAVTCLVAFAQHAQKKPSDKHGLLIYGKGVAFTAIEPEGWIADTDKLARDYEVNVIFIPKAKDSRERKVTIRVRVNDKVGENPQDDMDFDMNSYKKEYPKVEFADLASVHPKYKTSAKIFFEKNTFYEYVAYLNPGPHSKLMFSVSMSKEKSAATPAELDAFNYVLNSLRIMDNVNIINQK